MKPFQQTDPRTQEAPSSFLCDPEIKVEMKTERKKERKQLSHGTFSSLTIRAVDAGMLVVTEEEAVCALTLIAPHGVDTHLLAPAVVVQTLIHIC